MSVLKCKKHNAIFNNNEVCPACVDDEMKEVAYAPSILQELRNKADFVAVKESELQQLKTDLTAAQAEIARLKEELKKRTVVDGLSEQIVIANHAAHSITSSAKNTSSLLIEKRFAELEMRLKNEMELNRRLANRNSDLQSALDVAVEGLKVVKNNSAHSLHEKYNQVPSEYAAKTLDKIKQIKNSTQ